MSSVGPYLRALREAHGVSLEEVSRATRVGAPQLAALEADDYAALPAPIFIKGFIRAYCQTLGEPPGEALTRFDQAGWTGPATTARGAVVVPRVAREARGSHLLVSLLLFVMLGVALATVTLALRPRRHRPDPAPTAVMVPAPATRTGSPVESPLPVVSPGPAGSSAGAAPTASAEGPPTGRSASPGAASVAGSAEPVARRAAPAPAGAEEPRAVVTSPPAAPRYRLVARTSEATWIRVRTEEGALVEETIPAGQVREWRSNAPLVLTVGNAGGIALELNGRALPALGERGVVVRRLVVPESGS